ncbi:hypothetical protein BRADI_3g35041v3 [Brachypodium distachyon]|uniref:Uncharacterized protein n=1 Tax=Brachypodium distachyon TaxID=15368 RepID=A0A2K2D173_BRADI|nr:hypothetical protein BRADI_3g35041v3 [Brachypodium distachyon]
MAYLSATAARPGRKRGRERGFCGGHSSRLLPGIPWRIGGLRVRGGGGDRLNLAGDERHKGGGALQRRPERARCDPLLPLPSTHMAFSRALSDPPKWRRV